MEVPPTRQQYRTASGSERLTPLERYPVRRTFIIAGFHGVVNGEIDRKVKGCYQVNRAANLIIQNMCYCVVQAEGSAAVIENQSIL